VQCTFPQGLVGESRKGEIHWVIWCQCFELPSVLDSVDRAAGRTSSLKRTPVPIIPLLNRWRMRNRMQRDNRLAQVHRGKWLLKMICNERATVCKTVRPMLSDRCLSVCPVSLACLSVTLVYCGQTVGQIKMKLGMRVGLSHGHVVLDGDPARPPKGAHPPIFDPFLL